MAAEPATKAAAGAAGAAEAKVADPVIDVDEEIVETPTIKAIRTSIQTWRNTEAGLQGRQDSAATELRKMCEDNIKLLAIEISKSKPIDSQLVTVKSWVVRKWTAVQKAQQHLEDVTAIAKASVNEASENLTHATKEHREATDTLTMLEEEKGKATSARPQRIMDATAFTSMCEIARTIPTNNFSSMVESMAHLSSKLQMEGMTPPRGPAFLPTSSEQIWEKMCSEEEGRP